MENQTSQNNTSPNAETLLKRAFLFLEDEEFDSTKDYFNRVLDINPECAKAYMGLFMVEAKITSESNINHANIAFSENKHFKKALRFADKEYKAVLESYAAKNIKSTAEPIYQEAKNLKDSGDYEAALTKFKQLGNYLDSKDLTEFCTNEITARKQAIYSEAIKLKNRAKYLEDYAEALIALCKVKDYRDAGIYIEECKEAIYCKAKELLNTKVTQDFIRAQKAFKLISGYRDSTQLANFYDTREEPIKVVNVSSLVCPKCGEVNRGTLAYCFACGAALGKPVVSTAKNDVSFQPDNKKVKNSTNNRKVVTIVVLIIIVSTFTSIFNNRNTLPPNTLPEYDGTISQTVNISSLHEDAVLNDITVSVNRIDRYSSVGGSLWDWSSGHSSGHNNVWIGFWLYIDNTSSSDQLVSIKVFNNNNVELDYCLIGSENYSRTITPFETVSPGRRRSGGIAFLAPTNTTNVEIEVSVFGSSEKAVFTLRPQSRW
jgi:hypothetical protein